MTLQILRRHLGISKELFTYEQEMKHELDNRLVREFERAEAIAKETAEGEATGMAKGAQNEKELLAKKLLQKGLPPEEVAELTGLSCQFIEGL